DARLRRRRERIAVPDDDVRAAADGDRAGLVRDARRLRRPERDGAQRIVGRQPLADLFRREQPQEPRAAAVCAGAERWTQPRRDEPRRESGRTLRQRTVVARSGIAKLRDDDRALLADELLRVRREPLAARDRRREAELLRETQRRGDVGVG